MNCVLFAKMDQVFGLKKKQKLKKYWKNGKKYWKSQGILSVRKSENHVLRQRRLFPFQVTGAAIATRSIPPVNRSRRRLV